jgi:hypothetical protein
VQTRSACLRTEHELKWRAQGLGEITPAGDDEGPRDVETGLRSQRSAPAAPGRASRAGARL